MCIVVARGVAVRSVGRVGCVALRSFAVAAGGGGDGGGAGEGRWAVAPPPSAAPDALSALSHRLRILCSPRAQSSPSTPASPRSVGGWSAVSPLWMHRVHCRWRGTAAAGQIDRVRVLLTALAAGTSSCAHSLVGHPPCPPISRRSIALGRRSPPPPSPLLPFHPSPSLSLCLRASPMATPSSRGPAPIAPDKVGAPQSGCGPAPPSPSSLLPSPSSSAHPLSLAPTECG